MKVPVLKAQSLAWQCLGRGRNNKEGRKQLGSLHGTDLSPLQMCDNHVAWSLNKASNSESRDLSLALS